MECDQACVKDEMTAAFYKCEQKFFEVLMNNLGYFLALFTFYLAVRFGPALISWYRHRNDPKQMNLF